MGSEVSSSCQQSEDFAEFLAAYKKKPSKQPTRNYTEEEIMQQKWTQRFLRVLNQSSKQHEHTEYCKQLQEAIVTLGEDQFVRAQTIIKAIDNRQVSNISSREVFKDTVRLAECKRSSNVLAELPKLLKSGISQSPQEVVYGESFQQGKPTKGRLLKNLSYVLIREFNQQYHPVHSIKESFVPLFEDKFTLKLARYSDCREQSIQELYEEMHADLQFYCRLVADGCKRAYQSWVQKSIQLTEVKYSKMMMEVALLSLFADGDMYEVLFLLTRSVNYNRVVEALKNIPNGLSIYCFQIRRDLEIEGKFVRALALLTKIESISSPKYLVRALTNLKHEICNDVDSFYTANCHQQKLGIDSDNLLAITCYLLCQHKCRLLHLLSQMQVLFIIYGEAMSTVFEDSSYMFTVLSTALDIVLGPDLHKNFKVSLPVID